MKGALFAIVAIFCNVIAQLSMKYAGTAGLSQKGLSAWGSPWLIVAVLLYGASFLLTVKVYAHNPLSVASPAMAGGSFFLVTLIGWLGLGEPLTPSKIVGIMLIAAGILFLTRP